MCNFTKQDNEVKAFIHLFMKEAAQNIGGENFLLTLIETIKNKKPHPLMLKEAKIFSNNSIIKWNKTIFKDKIDLIHNILIHHRNSHKQNLNILNEPDSKKRKNILNMVRTLAPVEFFVTPQNHNDGDGFNFKIFDKTEDKGVKLNPIFIAIFFCSVEFTKKALKYKIKPLTL